MVKIKKLRFFWCIAILGVCIAYFFVTTVDSVFTVHDDILTYMQVKQGALWQTALNDARHGRICHIPMTLLLYIPYLFNSTVVLRIFGTAAVVFDMAALYILIKNNSDRNTAYLSCLLFIAFAGISNQHNLLVSYIAGHQIPIGLVLLSLNEFTQYYGNKHQTTTLIKSAVWLFIASFLYEACAAYIIIFLLISMYKNKGNIFGNCRKILYDTHFHILFLLIFTVIYLVWRSFYPSDYDGANLYFGNIPKSIITMVIYSLGMTPGLPAFAMLIKKYITKEEFFEAATPAMLIVPLLTAVTFYFVFPKIKNPKNKGTLALLCITAMLTPNIIISFTPKYAEWTSKSSYSYVTSYYSYFFMIPLFLIVLKTLFKKETKAVLISMSVIVFAAAFAAAAGNTAWNVYFGKNLDRYRAFEASVQDDFFDSLGDKTTVYIPDYKGIHHDMNITKAFATIYTSSDIRFTNNRNEIDFSAPVVFLKYDPSSKTMIAGSLDSSFTANDAFYIYGENKSQPVTTFALE